MKSKSDLMRWAPAGLTALLVMLSAASAVAHHAGHGSHGGSAGHMAQGSSPGASSHGSHGQQQPAAAQAATSEFAEAEVRRVNKAAGKITLRHGEIRNLDMPPMTMVFEVKDRAFLDLAKAGMKVRFKAEKSASGYVVTHIEPGQ
jgi:Cu(I)/Ag(I) efflux system protein CusF